MDVFLQQIINGLVLGSMYALIALGYTMVYGIINLINFAHGEVLMVGALTSWTIIGLMQSSMPGTAGWVILLVSLLIAFVVCGSLNFVIEKVAYRPLRNAPTQLMKELDYGKNYRYAHNEEDAFAAGENYFPEGMAAPGFYRPVARGLEIKIAEKLNALKLKNNLQS